MFSVATEALPLLHFQFRPNPSSQLFLHLIRLSRLYKMDRNAKPNQNQLVIRSFNDQARELIMKMFQTTEKNFFLTLTFDTKSDYENR